MKVKILGSAAAECVPAVWCECETCKYAREHGGKDIRRRTSYLIDDDILVDYGPDSFWQVIDFHIDLLKINKIFFTHSHEDHLNPVDLRWRGAGFSQVTKQIDIYGDAAVRERLLRDWKNNSGYELSLEDMKINFHLLLAGNCVKEPSLEVLALPANHAPTEKPLFYLFTRNGKSLLIANDTGEFPEQVWELLKGRTIDAMIIDCTGGTHPKHGYTTDCHLGAFADEQIKDKLIDLGYMKPSAPVVINHFSHNAHSLHHEMEAIMNPRGIQVGYDGMELNL